MSAEEHTRFVVIGGGIAGMSAAYRLQQMAPAASITLVEGEERLGGKLMTERVDGYTIEAGPDSFLSSKPQAIALAEDVGLKYRLQGVNGETRRSFVMRDGHLHDLPEGLSGLVPGKLGPLMRSDLISLHGKVRAAAEYVIPRGPGGDETLGTFMRRRMGSEVYERLIEPLMAGIYGGNGDELSLNATFPQLRAMEQQYGSLLRAMRALRVPGGRSPSPFLAPIGGMGELVEALEARMTVRILRGSYVRQLMPADSGWHMTTHRGERLEADAVILAVPAWSASDLLKRVDVDLARSLQGIPYTSSATVSLGYRQGDLERPLRGHGYLIPRREGRPVLACTWSSSKFHGRAPEGHTLVRVFLGRRGREEVLERPDDALIALARSEMRTTLGINTKPDIARIYRWNRAMPQYTVGHLDRLARIERRLSELPGLALAGAAYRGVGIPDCIRSGEDAAALLA